METNTAAHIDQLDLDERADFDAQVDLTVCGLVQGDHVCTSSIDHVDDGTPCHCPCGTDF